MISFINKLPDGLIYHQKVDDSFKVGCLPAGTYRMEEVFIGHQMVYGFFPLESTNDKPLEVDSKAIELANEIDVFLKKASVFKSFGFSHKRGYLLHGAPGCGKSTTLRLLQKHFIEKFNGVILIWKQRDFENHLAVLREHEPNRPVMVICEDIDGLVEQFERQMLEVLDGQTGLNNFVLVATTNNLEEIPSRIKDRPSRIDRIVEMGLPDASVRKNYLETIGLDSTLIPTYVEASEGLSIAKLKEIVIATVCFDEKLDVVVERLKDADMTANEHESVNEYGDSH